MKQNVILSLFVFGVCAGGIVWFVGDKAKPQAPAKTTVVRPIYEDAYVPSSSPSALGGRGIASEGEEVVVAREVAHEEVNTLTDNGVSVHTLSRDTKFTNAYGEFTVEVIADPHNEDAPSLMKFYVKCKDNRPVKSGPPPARELIKEANVNGHTTCKFDSVTFVENQMYGDFVRATYHTDVSRSGKKKYRNREFCDQLMNLDFNFPELCEKWNPGAFSD